MAANNIYIQVDFNSQSAQQNVNALNQAIGQTGTAAEKTSKQATAALDSVSVSVKHVNNEVAQLTTALAGLGIARAVTGMVQMTAELSRSQLAMEAFAGSAADANKVFEQVRAIAATSPFRFKDLEEASQRLLGFGMAAKNVPDTVKLISDQVARMGGSIEGVNTIVNVFGRIMEKNFVGAMDLMRALPAQGIPALKALGDAMSKELGRPVDIEETKKALKEGLFDPLQTIRILLDSLRQKGDASRFSDDAARAFKNLADAADFALTKLFGPEGFGPALKKLGDQISDLLAPLGGVIDYLMKLPESTKETILTVAAAAAAFTVFGTALGIVVNLASPLLGLVAALGEFTVGLAAMNPELAIATVLLGGLAFAAYKLIPQFKDLVDNLVGGVTDKIKSALSGLAEEGKKFMAGIFSGGAGIDVKSLVNPDALFETLRQAEEKHATEAKRSMLEALASPVEAVRLKYAQLFADLEEKMKDLKDPQQKQALRDILGGAETAETEGARFKQEKKDLDELTRYQIEKVKGSYAAQIAYIEALDEKDLNRKVAAIDQVTALRIASAEEVAKLQDAQLQESFEKQRDYLEEHRADLTALGVDVNSAVRDREREMAAKQKVIDEQAVDDGQKYRLEGWKKANDAIIEDQKRVFDAFKSEFDQLFDAFTSKSPGKAIANVFRSLAMGEARELFSSTAAAGATAAAGYGVPSEEIGKGGILSQLIRRGMPSRPPMAPPDLYTPARAPTVVSFEDGANRLVSSADTYNAATLRFALAVARFSGTASQGSADRMADDGGATPSESALLGVIRGRESSGNYGAQSQQSTASGAYQFIDSTWRMAAQATGQGTEYKHAKDAPQSVQDANALWLLRRYGPNSTASWAESGPYGAPAPATGGADYTVSGPSAVRLPEVANADTVNYGWATSGSAMSLDQMMALPTVARTGVLPALLHAASGAGSPAQLTKLFSNWKGMLGFGAVHGQTPGSESMATAATGPGVSPAGAFSWSGLATSPLAKAGAGMAGGLLANYGLLGPSMGTGAGILEGTVGGAGVGFSIGGPLGAGIGAAAGLGIGVGEMLAGVESPRNQAKRLANQLYHIAINNATADQIAGLAQQSYGGSVSRAMRSPEVRHMLGLFAAGTGQSMAQGFNDPHGASLVESGGMLQQQSTYQYGNPYVQSSNLPTYGGVAATTLGAPGGLSLSLNIGGTDAAKFMTGSVVTPDVVQTQYASAMSGSNGRVAQALMLSEPGSVAG
jgi:Tape measure protein